MLTRTGIISFVKNKLIFNLIFCFQSFLDLGMSGILMVTFFYLTFTSVYLLMSRFCVLTLKNFFWTFFSHPWSKVEIICLL